MSGPRIPMPTGGEPGIQTRPTRATHNMAMERGLARYVCALLGVSVVTALALFCLEGFHAWGFNLDVSLMHWIGGATIGMVGTLAMLVYRAFFAGRARGSNGGRGNRARSSKPRIKL